MARGYSQSKSEAGGTSKWMPSGSVDNIVAQYERAKVYDGRIRSMSPDEIKKEVEDIKQFGVISNAQVDAIIVAQENVKDNNYEARINLLEREKVLYSRVVAYLDQRRTENPMDDITSDWTALENNQPYKEKYKELISEIEKDEAFLSKKWPGKTPDIKTQQGRDAERNRRVIIQQVEERIQENKDDFERIEKASSNRLKSIKETFDNLFKT